MADGGTPSSRGLSAPATNTPVGGTAEILGASGPAGHSLETVAGSQSWTVAKAIFPGYTIRRTVPEVRFQFSIADERGRLVTGLSLADFRIFDNQSAVQRIRHFSRLDDLPLQLGILLDVSDSVRKSVGPEKLAAHSFFQQVLRPQTDRAFLTAFSRDVKLWQSSTGDLSALHQALDRIQQAGYPTNLYDSLFAACAGLFPQTDGQDTTQRILVLFSDGEDTGSLRGLPDVIARAQRNEIQIFALSIHAVRVSTTGDKVLRRLADETGGQFYVAASDKEFPAIFADMEQQMRTQYAVSFQPVQETPGFHALRLELTGSQKVHVRSRQGYYFDAP